MERSDQSPEAAPTGPPQRRFLDVARAIQASINVGEFGPTGRLPGDRDLAVAHGVSRSTAREALLALELIGAVVIRHGDGVYVSQAHSTSIDESRALLNGEPRDLIESRRMLEPITTRLAAARITQEQVDQLAELVDEAERIGPDLTQFHRFAQVGFSFHAVLANFCGNALLSEFVEQLVSVEQHPLWVLVNEQALRSPSARLAQVTEHRAVIEALRAHDADKAEFCMRSHLADLETLVFPTLPAR
jgi:DNA-binding FadR family transcriptional regulator